MANTKNNRPAGEASSDAPPSEQPAGGLSKNIFAVVNRGMLLDIVVFLMNLFLMRILAKQFVDLYERTSSGDKLGEYAMFFFCIGIFVLPAAGAVLKRWPFQHRLQVQGRTLKDQGFALGCLFNPILYFCLNMVIFIGIYSFILQDKYGDNETTTSTVVMLVLAFTLPTIQTVLVYRYFSLPKKDPPIAFLKSPLSEHLGDVCIFVNMILFQVVWNWLLFSFLGFTHPSGFSDFIARLFFLLGIALFIYFPPRMFYLAEDIRRPRVWVTILLANLPVIVRVLIGTSSTNW